MSGHGPCRQCDAEDREEERERVANEAALVRADALAAAVEAVARDPLQHWVCMCPTNDPACALCKVTAAARAYRQQARQP